MKGLLLCIIVGVIMHYLDFDIPVTLTFVIGFILIRELVLWIAYRAR